MSTPLRDISIIHLAETDSTNEEAKRRGLTAGQEGVLCVWADYQSAGRGQKGTRWEAEPGKNLLFSVMLRPEGVAVGEQFVLSQAMALAVRDAVATTLPSPLEGGDTASPFRGIEGVFPQLTTIKWPNDIYVGERKLSGTIIETTLSGQRVERCVLGVGINVNQTTFRGDAPNPVSLRQLLGHDVDREALLHAVLRNFLMSLKVSKSQSLKEFSTFNLQPSTFNNIRARYADALIWRVGLHTYRDARDTFRAEFVGVEPDGHLLLRDEGGLLRRYYFKEVRHVFSEIETE